MIAGCIEQLETVSAWQMFFSHPFKFGVLHILDKQEVGDPQVPPELKQVKSQMVPCSNRAPCNSPLRWPDFSTGSCLIHMITKIDLGGSLCGFDYLAVGLFNLPPCLRSSNSIAPLLRKHESRLPLPVGFVWTTLCSQNSKSIRNSKFSDEGISRAIYWCWHLVI